MEKTNFSQTCSLLSQYLKEKRSFGGFGLDMAPLPLEQQQKGFYKPPTTMSLMPGVDTSEENEEDTKALNTMTPEMAQLTIFYDGKVLVFDNFSGEKFKDLLEIASKQSIVRGEGGDGCFLRHSPSGGQVAVSQHTIPRPLQANASDMPIARRKSLQRFLEKRKDRVNTNAPYQVKEYSSATKSEDSKSWLGLGRQDL